MRAAVTPVKRSHASGISFASIAGSNDRGNHLTPVTAHQYSRIAISKYQVRRISITSYSRARPGGNTW